VATLKQISGDLPLIFPVHPRVRRQLQALRGAPGDSGLRVVDPLGYLDFLALERQTTWS
jgi:UDP-N-acetylglucosamine 2-epimerase (non-hydrolysing)